MVKITSVDIFKAKLELKYVVVVSLGSVSTCDNIIIRVNTDAGISGWGEASPFSFITGETPETAFEATKFYASHLIGKDATAIKENWELLNRQMPSHPSVRSAFDMALWDILGKEANMPVYKLLGGKKRELRTDITMGHENTVEDVQKLARDYVGQGFDEIKMKTGRSGNIDYEHVKGVREVVGEKVHLKIDSNQGWDLATALGNARLMEPLDLMYFEQPLPVWNLDDMARLRQKINIPVCADESVFDDIDAFKICKLGAADYLNIKLGKAAGISTGLKINAIAESYGAKCMIGCFSESRLGLTAAAHLVLARPNIVFLDLDSAFFLSDDPVIGGMEYDKEIGGLIHVPDTPGLGLEVKEEYLTKWEKVSIS